MTKFKLVVGNLGAPAKFEILLGEHLDIIEREGGKNVNLSYSMVPPVCSCLIKWDAKGEQSGKKQSES